MRPASLRLLTVFAGFSLLMLNSGCRTWTRRERQAVVAFNDANDLHKKGQLQAAEKAYRQALKLQRNLAAASYNLALTLVELKKYEEAQETLQTLRKRNPENLKIIRTQGWAADQSGSYQQALDYYQQALDIFASDRETLKAMVQTLEKAEAIETAIEKQSLLLRLDDTAKNHLIMAELYLKNSQDQKAFLEYQFLLAQGEVAPESLLAAGEAAESLEDYKQASKFYQKVADQDATLKPQALFQLGRLQLLHLLESRAGINSLKNAIIEGYKNDEEFYNLLLELPPDLVESVKVLLTESEDESENP